MSRKIRCIYIDGVDKSGKTSVTREVRKYLKSKSLDLYEMNGIDDNKLKLQNILLQDNFNSVILKENSVLSLFQNHVKKGLGLNLVEPNHLELLRKEQNINHVYGCVYFFLIPESADFTADRFKQIPDDYAILNSYNFFKNIHNYSIFQGLDIHLITFYKDDKIFDIRDKILQILEKNYKI